GSAYAIYTLAKIFNKEAYIQNINFDDTGLRQVEKVFGMQKNLIFINPRVATSFNGPETLVVLVDIADENRIENKQAFKDINKNNVIVIDHHR
ncbi:DHH family protein, partial [Chlamydia psittaci 01DC11]